MDASVEEALEMLVKRLRSAGLGFAMCGIKGQIISVMQRTGLYDKIGTQHIFPDSRAAVAALIDRIHKGTDLPEAGCGNCPLQQYIPAESIRN
jgi:MFS superfamily sulfate permease-like transporter